MQFWKEHVALRVALMVIFFGAGLALLIFGWKMTGKMSGLILMLVGLVLLLAALMIYNKPFQEPKQKKR